MPPVCTQCAGGTSGGSRACLRNPIMCARCCRHHGGCARHVPLNHGAVAAPPQQQQLAQPPPHPVPPAQAPAPQPLQAPLPAQPAPPAQGAQPAQAAAPHQLQAPLPAQQPIPVIPVASPIGQLSLLLQQLTSLLPALAAAPAPHPPAPLAQSAPLVQLAPQQALAPQPVRSLSRSSPLSSPGLWPQAESSTSRRPCYGRQLHLLRPPTWLHTLRPLATSGPLSSSVRLRPPLRSVA
jgi:hypothetical protein